MAGYRHGLSGTRLNQIHIQVKGRCLNPNNAAYASYGGRGIKLDLDWYDFVKFRQWALANGYASNLIIDREDNDGDYCPDNCRWTTHKVNNRNSRHNRLVTAFGETKCMTEWMEDERCKTTLAGLRKRLNRGWSHEEAITCKPIINQFSTRK